MIFEVFLNSFFQAYLSSTRLQAVSCEDCFPENTECILKYSKCVPLPYKRSVNPIKRVHSPVGSINRPGQSRSVLLLLHAT
ncbi:hypothetical protein AALO_G00106520 [Alosa alosa]|uniref:Secreted protein n=1 Tax=Alosa alosa TaxID=278164 RepID=A0AAV6GSH5_9TELE|nr:hypothetical protein AALO_G00106520 [Alosa alosa]